jgi:lipid II:glycine glycyltransferase (peptidoglycan interpeptide bridge formation enzyme)
MEKHEDKKNFLTVDIKSFFRSIAKTFRTDISMLLLTINGVVIAATFSFITDSVYYLYNSGFDNTLYPNAGFYLKAMSIKRAIEKGYTVYNFLQGDERYKYELGAKDFYVYSITYQP